MPAEGLAEQAWWTRVERAAKRQGPEGSKVMSDWARDRLAVVAAEEGDFDLVGSFGHRRWQPIPPERCTEECKAAEMRRLDDELGRRLGVGQMP